MYTYRVVISKQYNNTVSELIKMYIIYSLYLASISEKVDVLLYS